MTKAKKYLDVNGVPTDYINEGVAPNPDVCKCDVMPYPHTFTHACY